MTCKQLLHPGRLHTSCLLCIGCMPCQLTAAACAALGWVARCGLWGLCLGESSLSHTHVTLASRRSRWHALIGI